MEFLLFSSVTCTQGWGWLSESHSRRSRGWGHVWPLIPPFPCQSGSTSSLRERIACWLPLLRCLWCSWRAMCTITLQLGAWIKVCHVLCSFLSAGLAKLLLELVIVWIKLRGFSIQCVLLPRRAEVCLYFVAGVACCPCCLPLCFPDSWSYIPVQKHFPLADWVGNPKGKGKCFAGLWLYRERDWYLLLSRCKMLRM